MASSAVKSVNAIDHHRSSADSNLPRSLGLCRPDATLLAASLALPIPERNLTDLGGRLELCTVGLITLDGPVSGDKLLARRFSARLKTAHTEMHSMAEEGFALLLTYIRGTLAS